MRHFANHVLLVLTCLALWPDGVQAQPIPNEKFQQRDHFRQLEELLPTANEARTASGAPGHEYWQQRADYTIDVEIDDENQRIIGSEVILYRNNSPDTLRYLWVQLDPNIFAKDSHSPLVAGAPELERVPFSALRSMLAREAFDGGVKVTAVADARGKPLPHTIVKTMMRIDLPQPLRSGEDVRFSIDWNYAINNSKLVRGRTGYEYFEEDGNYLYEIAQWFPRMAAYSDATGWQHKQYLGRGEFTLEFGDYVVRITAPDDHIVAASGVLQNPADVLTAKQRERLKKAAGATTPVFVVTPEEALRNEASKSTDRKTWVFRAENVRDFAFASSRKFIWDAQGISQNGRPVMAMSYYPKEGEPLWSRYSTHAIIHTIRVYSRYTFDYPYPVAISVNGPVGGMEYPMICFNGPRPEKDGTWSKRSKYGLISVVIHEVGHNYFPMIVNSDERQWTWMDEGLNTFLQYLAEQEWEEDYPSRRGEPEDIVAYMTSEKQVPIMTNSESLLQFGSNAYAKPATALNILRETVLGRELFDFAFREYAQRWKFKRPMPADFFRTMEDASGVDLDWFWRGWFYSTAHCDIGIEDVRLFTIDTMDPDVEKPRQLADREERPKTLSAQRNQGLDRRVERFGDLRDFYNSFDKLDVTDADREAYRDFVSKLESEERELLENRTFFYVIDLENIGGLVMPVILELEFVDGTRREIRIPAEIWRQNAERVSKLIMSEKEIARIILDPHLETADADERNNHYPPQPLKSRFQLYKQQRQKNEMQRARDANKKRGEGSGEEPR